MVWCKVVLKLSQFPFELITYQETVTLSEVYLHPSRQLLQRLDRVEWRLWASPPSCGQNKGKRSGWGAPSYGLSGSHRSSQSVASEIVVLVNKLSARRELFWKRQHRNCYFKSSLIWH